MTVRLGDRVFVFEFKVVETAPPGGAMEQLRAKRYHEKFMGRGLEVYLVGVEFNKTERNISGFGWERVE